MQRSSPPPPLYDNATAAVRPWPKLSETQSICLSTTIGFMNTEGPRCLQQMNSFCGQEGILK
jgi:hypothetical protein